MELVSRSDAGGEFTAQGVKNQCQGPRRSTDYGLVNQTQSQGSGGASRLSWDECVLAGFNVLPQILTYSIILNSTPFALLSGQGPCTQLDSVMRVIDVWHACHWCFAMPVNPSLVFYHASH